MMSEETVRKILLETNEEFKELFEQHQKLEHELENLLKKWYLTEEEKLKERTLKWQKLLLKDRMYHMIHTYIKSHQNELVK